MIELARNLAALGRELLDSLLTAITPRAIDAAVSSPLLGHVDHQPAPWTVTHDDAGIHATSDQAWR